ncbi:protein phosphatase 2C domain-containing protein [Treponema sp.]|uniref:protein phosphatase 2C domain-containing protein n=1 Tax=Treponema sp. TaxID=166 RepID=UPI0025E66048|nr:protein phosphatase 2C domain-containing protein [Treponema sp.]MBR4323096.1 protein phosphatase 2C domain-containing protein [Treponema sp.]
MNISQNIFRCNFAKSIQGASHIRKEEREENLAIGRKFPCQDKSFSEYFAADFSHKTGYWLTVVCDGHGGAPYFRSERGAELAIASIQKNLPDYIDRIAENLSKENIISLVPALLKTWGESVDSDLVQNPITQTEYKFLEMDDAQAAERYKAGEDLHSIYGATFLCFVSATIVEAGKNKNFWFALQIGDGDIAVHSEKGFFMPVPDDERNFLNQTTSLCDKNAENEFRVAFGVQNIDAVLCSTDGIANSFANENQLFSFYDKVLTLFRTYDFEQNEDSNQDLEKRNTLAIKEIESSLPDISRRGSGDDLTLAGFVDIDIEIFKKHIAAKNLLKRGKIYQGMPLIGSSIAEKSFLEAAQNGYPEGFYQLALMQKDRVKKIEYFSKAAEGGIKEAKEPLSQLLLEEAQDLQKKGNHAKAFSYFIKAAEAGLKEAQWAASLYYGRPQDYPDCGVKQNFAKAIDLTLAAAKQGHAQAECKLGKCYRDGRGVQQNSELSIEWYKKAASHGSAEAQEYLKQIGV